MNAMNMLDYSKIILKKVSFDRSLFEKELKKSFKYLLPEEIQELLGWAKMNFSQYAEVLNRLQPY